MKNLQHTSLLMMIISNNNTTSFLTTMCDACILKLPATMNEINEYNLSPTLILYNSVNVPPKAVHEKSPRTEPC